MDNREIEKLEKEQHEGLKRQSRLGMHDQTTDTAGYGMIQGTQQTGDVVNRVMDKDVLVRMLHQRSHELQMSARGMQRLAELVGAAGPHDFELFSVLFNILKLR